MLMEGYTGDFCEKIKIPKNWKIDQSTTISAKTISMKLGNE